LQALRFLAALLVVLIHWHLWTPAVVLPGRLVLVLHVAVDVFFVLSGFIMAYIGARAAGRGRFLARRLARVGPLYWTLTGLVFVLAWWQPAWFHSSRADAWQLIQSLAFIPFEKSPGTLEPLLFLGWTLNYEVFFYTLFALCLPWCQRERAAVLILLGLVILGLCLRPEQAAARFYTSPIVLEFGLGLILYRLYRLHPQPSIRIALASLFVGAAALWGLHGLVEDSSPQALLRPLYFGLPAMGFVAAALWAPAVRGTLPVRLGDASYSLYLLHPFVLAALLGVGIDRLRLSAATTVALAACLIVAWSSYYWLERRVHHRLKTLLSRNPS